MKNKKLVKVIRTLWSSLDTHLDDTYSPISKTIRSKVAKKHIGGKKFHTTTVREYAEAIKILTELL